jgi:predicted SAM-dependent methyltransferase
VILNLGAGPVRLEGAIGVDLHATAGCDVQADILRLPFRDGCAELVVADHVLEHLPQRFAVAALLEARRVLRPGGRIRVGVPDLLAYCEKYLEADAKDDHQEKALLLRGLYGGQFHEGEHHLSGWDEDTLGDLLEAVGFADVLTDEDDGPNRTEGWCLKAEGVKR